MEKTQYLINTLYFSAIAGYLQLLLQGLLRIKFLVEYFLGLITETRILDYLITDILLYNDRNQNQVNQIGKPVLMRLDDAQEG